MGGAQPGGLWVTVDTDEIDRLASGADVAVEELSDVRRRIRASQDALTWGGGVPALVELMRLTAALGAALVACETALAAATDRARQLREATREYDGAETVTFWDRLLATAGQPSSMPSLLPSGASLGLVLRNLVRGEYPMPGSLVGAYAGTSLLPRWGTWASRLVDVRPQDPVAFALRDVRLLPPQPSAGSPGAAGPGDLPGRIGLAYAASGEQDSAVDVQRIDHVDGGVSWIVSVPGTMGGLRWPWETDQPMSADTNVPAFLGQTTAADALVIAAMVRAGVRSGQPVLLAGHSLSGMTVTQLANDDAVRRRFDIAGVVTFGAPVAHLPAVDVPMLNVQHAEDGVPALSGELGSRPGGPASGEVVVVRELGEQLDGSTDAHGIGVYRETAQLLVDAHHPGMAAFDEATAHIWAGEGDTVTATTYRGSRT